MIERVVKCPACGHKHYVHVLDCEGSSDNTRRCDGCRAEVTVKVTVKRAVYAKMVLTESDPGEEWPAPGSDRWFQHDGRLWCATSGILLRPPCPLPACFLDGDEWATSAGITIPADILTRPMPPVPLRWPADLAPLLQATEPVPGTMARTINGEIVAVISPAHPAYTGPTVDERGQP